jgi:hypothetical protein
MHEKWSRNAVASRNCASHGSGQNWRRFAESSSQFFFPRTGTSRSKAAPIIVLRQTVAFSALASDSASSAENRCCRRFASVASPPRRIVSNARDTPGPRTPLTMQSLEKSIRVSNRWTYLQVNCSVRLSRRRGFAIFGERSNPAISLEIVARVNDLNCTEGYSFHCRRDLLIVEANLRVVLLSSALRLEAEPSVRRP